MKLCYVLFIEGMILEQGIEQHYKAIHGMKVRYIQIHYIVACIAQKIITYFFQTNKRIKEVRFHCDYCTSDW